MTFLAPLQPRSHGGWVIRRRRACASAGQYQRAGEPYGHVLIGLLQRHLATIHTRYGRRMLAIGNLLILGKSTALFRVPGLHALQVKLPELVRFLHAIGIYT